MASELPAPFGSSWEEFQREWCLGAPLAHGRSEVIRALASLQRLHVAEVARLVAGERRGVGTIAPAIELGCLLWDCEHVHGFQEVLARFAGGERSAYSELVLVSALKGLGYATRFGPPIGGSVLDALCTADGQEIWFEVVAPEWSDASVAEQASVDALQEQVRGAVSACRVEIEVFGPLVGDSAGRVVDAIRAAKGGEWVLVESIARVRRIDSGERLPPVFDGDGAQIVVAGDKTMQGNSTAVIARWDSKDARAKRLFEGEYHHFAEGVPNVLVVNVCAVSDGMNAWPLAMVHRLQPGRNRRVGAVAFFAQGILGPPWAVRRRWRLVVNPHAHVPIPEALLRGLESLDESPLFGLPRPGRVVAG